MLRQTAILQRPTETQDSSGAVIQTWATLAKRRVDVRPISGREFFGNQQDIGEVSHRIKMRYDADIADLSPKDRLSLGGRIFNIQSVHNIQERRREFELMCREVV
jgi:SPP1 family predicted phage head-tail adaptor